MNKKYYKKKRKKKKRQYAYYLSVDFDSCITADNEEEALKQANEMIKNGQYSLIITDKEKVI